MAWTLRDKSDMIWAGEMLRFLNIHPKGDMIMIGFLKGLWERWSIRGIVFFKWTAFACLIGALVGAVGYVFHTAVDMATVFRQAHPYFIYFLPAAGVMILAMYQLCGLPHDPGTNYVLVAVRENAPIRLRMAPLIIISTVITHLFGGSSGREGAALQMGSSISDRLGRWMGLGDKDERIIMMCGMAAGFSALFGTPLAASVFAMEVCSVGVMYYAAIFPCILSALIAALLVHTLGGHPTAFSLAEIPELTYAVLPKVILLGILCAAAAILVCTVFGTFHRFFVRYIPKPYLRIAAGGALVIVLTLLSGTRAYNGAGMDSIEAALAGQARPEAFLVKMVFTAVTLGSGFKGGEIVPALFIGATFGCTCGGVLGLPAGFAGALGMGAVFCGVTNCPLTAVLLSYELFGGAGLPLFALCIAVSYMLSGYRGLYSEQKIMYSKYSAEFVGKRSGDES